MTENIRALKDFQWDRAHHAVRRPLPEGIEAAYRKPDMPDVTRTAVRLETALSNEIPYIAPGEIIAFTRTLPNLPRIFDDAEWAEITANHFIHELGNVSNLTPDYGRIIAGGLLPMLEQLGEQIEHQAMRRSINAVLNLTARYEWAAREQGRTILADTLSQVPAHGARTFREALQSLRILHYVMWCEGDYHNTLGRFDQYMMPYLKADLDAGRETEESAFELLEAFFLTCNRDSDLYPGMQQGDNGQSIVLGGVTPDGRDGYNLLSRMCLKASAELRLIDPKINLRVNKETPLEVYELGTELTKLGLGFPQYENDDVAVPALIALGYKPEDARNYAMAACWEFIIPGKGMEIPNIGALPFANVVDASIRQHLTTCADMNALKADIEQAIFRSVRESLADRKNLYVIPSPYLSMFFEGCVENARDISLGCTYNNWGMHGTGLAPAADMLAAVDHSVFHGDVAPETLLAAMEANFEGYARLQAKLRAIPKYGTDHADADAMARRVASDFSDMYLTYRTRWGGKGKPVILTFVYAPQAAAILGATADGGNAGRLIAHGVTPQSGSMTEGITAAINSVGCMPFEKFAGGASTMWDFDSSWATVPIIEAIIRTFIEKGGQIFQGNTTPLEELIEAQKHPEDHKQLIVRVGGYSARFVTLSKELQNDIIGRMRHGA